MFSYVSYVYDDVASEMAHVGDPVLVLLRDLRVLHQLDKVLLGDSVLALDVQQDDPDLVLDGHVLVQQHGDDVAHLLADSLALGVGAHGQVLLNLA